MLHFFNTDACYSAIDIFLKNMLSLQTIGEYHCTFLNVRIKCLLNLIIAWPCPVDCYSIRTTLITFYPCANTYPRESRNGKDLGENLPREVGSML